MELTKENTQRNFEFVFFGNEVTKHKVKDGVFSISKDQKLALEDIIYHRNITESVKQIKEFDKRDFGEIHLVTLNFGKTQFKYVVVCDLSYFKKLPISDLNALKKVINLTIKELKLGDK